MKKENEIHETHGKKLPLTIEGKQYEWSDQYIIGADIKALGNLLPECELFLSVQKPWKDELIANDTQIDLARPEIEHFYIRQKLKFTIDCRDFETDRQYIKGSEIRAKGQIPATSKIFLSIKGPWEDEEIKDDNFVDLAREGIEHFYSKEESIETTLIVNSRHKMWHEKTISFVQVIILAFNTYEENAAKAYTVNYADGPKENPQGSMVVGDVVCVKNKMIFNVAATDKS